MTEGIDINFEGVPFDDTAKSKWIKPTILDTLSTFHRQGSATQYAQTNNILYQINIFVKKSGVTQSDEHYRIKEIVNKYFKIGSDISVLDYANSGTTLINKMRVRSFDTDFSLPETNELLQYVLAYELNFTELTTK